MTFSKVSSLRGEFSVPGDKSISHRAIMLGSLAKGQTEITNFLQGADCLSTIRCFQQMGVAIDNLTDRIMLRGNGLHGLKCPDKILDTGNSGTTTRLLAGILAGQHFSAVINGDASIQKRPMGRIITPLSQMGAKITSLKNNDCAPFQIEGSALKGICYQSPVASAQVKSAILLAGLYAEGTTSVTEPSLSRNHTELMLRCFGVPVISEGTTASVSAVSTFEGQKLFIPGDISSAAYFMAAGLIVPHSSITIQNVGINPTRDGMLQVCRQMGGKLSIENKRILSGEPVADITVSSSSLKGITIGGDLIPTLIDEIPIIAVLACFADGDTIIKDAKELKVKESNRIAVMVENLSAMGAAIEATEDGMIIHGGKPLHGTSIKTYNDHRIAMSFAVAGLASDGKTSLDNPECVTISYPNFYEDLKHLVTL